MPVVGLLKVIKKNSVGKKVRRMTSQYDYGRKNEKLVAGKLRGRGASCRLSPGSRGPADVICVFPTGTKWDVQVKSTRKGQPKAPSTKDLGRLKAEATKTGATPVVAKVTRKKVTFASARTGRNLTVPNRRKK